MTLITKMLGVKLNRELDRWRDVLVDLSTGPMMGDKRLRFVPRQNNRSRQHPGSGTQILLALHLPSRE